MPGNLEQLQPHIHAEEQTLVDRFEAAFNAIDKQLSVLLAVRSWKPFVRLLDEYAQQRPGWNDYSLLKRAARLRNFLVHEKQEPCLYLATPIKSLVEELERIHHELLNRPRVVPKFSKEVETVTTQNTLVEVLSLISRRDYSQFPVYDAGCFKGLLTENGITRWLAHHVSNQLSLVEFDEVPVSQLLSEEEEAPNLRFVAEDYWVDQAVALFRNEELLEVILIAKGESSTEKPIGIITRWDILHLREGIGK